MSTAINKTVVTTPVGINTVDVCAFNLFSTLLTAEFLPKTHIFTIEISIYQLKTIFKQGLL